MTPQELAVLGFEYLTGKSSPLNSSDKDDIITSSTLEGMEGSSLKYFVEKLEDESVNDYDKEKNLGEVQGTVTHDIMYGFSIDDNDPFTIIINMTDVYNSVYQKGRTPYTELLNRVINSVIIESSIVDEIDLETIKGLVYDYAPIHQRVYDDFGTKNWIYVFTWNALEEFKKEQRIIWSNYIQSNNQPSATLPPFARFQESLKKQLTKYLVERKSVDFITQFVEEQIDTAHLYGMNEKRK